jgi:hypothetical protein
MARKVRIASFRCGVFPIWLDTCTANHQPGGYVAIDRNRGDGDSILDPEDVNSSPTTSSSLESDSDPNDEIPVPVAMSPAEVDERAQAVEAMRDVARLRPLDDRGPDA